MVIDYATILAAPDCGGYVLVAVLAFALGSTVAIFCIKMKQWMNQKNLVEMNTIHGNEED